MTDPEADPDVGLARLLAERLIARLGPEAPPLRTRRVERTEPDLVQVELSARVPLDTDVVEGVACWVCPQDRAHHAEPILPADA